MRSLVLLPFLLGLAFFAACIETDISVPGFPQMMEYFSVSEAGVQLTMSLNFLGFCLAGLLYGPLSDSYGRRPIMLFGNILFLIAAIGTASSTHIASLIFWRFLQGIGASATFTVAFAIIADAYQGQRASNLINRLNACVTAFMAGAPIAGGFLVEAFGWRSTYSTVAALCLISTVLIVFFLPETNNHKKLFQPKQILKDFRLLLTDFDFMALTMGLTFQCAGYMAFVASAVFAYTDLFHQSLISFTLHQGLVIAFFSGVSFFGGQINRWIGAHAAMLLGLFLNVLGAALLFIIATVGVQEAAAYTSAMCLFSIGVALCYGVTFTVSMELFPSLKGAAASLNGSIRLLLIALAIWGVGLIANGTFIPETGLIALSAVFGACLLGFASKKPRVASFFLKGSVEEVPLH